MTISPGGPETKGRTAEVDVNPVPASLEVAGKPGHFSKSLSKGPQTTTWIWNLHALAHDFDTQTNDLEEISRKIFSAHFGHLSIVFIWISGMIFHAARFSNYYAWLADPFGNKPSAHVVWPIVGQDILNADVGNGFHGIQITSGLFHILRGAGMTAPIELYSTSIGALVAAAVTMYAGYFHYHKKAPKLAWFQNAEATIGGHLINLLGLGNLAWTGHLIHVSLPINKMLDSGIAPENIPIPHEYLLDKAFMADLYPSFAQGLTPWFTLNWGVYADFLTFKGGLDPQTGGLWMTDIAHHHLALAVMYIIAGHMYRTNWGIGHHMKEIMEAHKGPFTGEGHKGLYEVLTNSWHAQLAINLSCWGSFSIIVAHHMYAMPPYPYLATDYATQLNLFVHHMWLGGFYIVGGAAHAAIFMVRDYDPEMNQNNVLDRMLRHRDTIIAHLNWVCLFLGFHSFDLYIHNDEMRSLGRPQDMFSDTAIQLQPIFAQWVQNLQANVAGTIRAPLAEGATSLAWGGDPLIVGGKVAMQHVSLGTADFMIHHIHAFQIHVTVLILLKGVLYARSSRLIPDKANLGFRFPCDGPGRGGTCQSSGWDHVFLGLFWMYNCISIVNFHFFWKMQSDVWGTANADGAISYITAGNWAQSSITINGWLRDFLWAQSVQVINSYGSALSAYGILFLGAHFIWAFSLMFLFSGRGYWQELIESIVWAHSKLKIAPAIQPRAMSITQGRAVGLGHYLLGGIVTSWSFYLARILALG